MTCCCDYRFEYNSSFPRTGYFVSGATAPDGKTIRRLNLSGTALWSAATGITNQAIHPNLAEDDHLYAGAASVLHDTVYRLNASTGAIETSWATTNRTVVGLVAEGGVTVGTTASPVTPSAGRKHFWSYDPDGALVNSLVLLEWDLSVANASPRTMRLDRNQDIYCHLNLQAPTGSHASTVNVVKIQRKAALELWRRPFSTVSSGFFIDCIAIDFNNRVWVSGSTALTLLDSSGTTLAHNVTAASRRISMDADASGNLYIISTGANQLQKWDVNTPASSTMLWGVTLPTPTLGAVPQHVTVVGNSVVIYARTTSETWVYDSSGSLQATFTSHGAAIQSEESGGGSRGSQQKGGPAAIQ